MSPNQSEQRILRITGGSSGIGKAIPSRLKRGSGQLVSVDICLARGTGAAVVLPRRNSQAMQWHLEEISAQVSLRCPAVLILDQAGWHGSNKLEVPPSITLMHLHHAH